MALDTFFYPEQNQQEVLRAAPGAPDVQPDCGIFSEMQTVRIYGQIISVSRINLMNAVSIFWPVFESYNWLTSELSHGLLY